MNDRIYAFDWLRCVAFLILIWVHSALMFTSYGWHLKFETINTLNYFIEFCRPWRMQLIFLVSGVALSYSFDNRGWFNFGLTSLRRLLLPLLFGMFILIPPVYYLESIHKGEEVPLLLSYQIYLDNFIHKDFRWLHLWYLGYLLFFCAIVSVMWQIFRRWSFYLQNKSWKKFQIIILLSFIAVILSINEALLRPIYPIKRDFIHDIASLISFFIMFNFGAIVVRNNDVLSLLSRFFQVNLLLSLVCYAISLFVDGFWQLVFSAVFALLFVCFLVGVSVRYFNRRMFWVERFNRIVFPFYLLHQLFILVAASILSKVLSGIMLYFAIVLLATVSCVLAIVVVLGPIKPLHPMLGMQKP